MRASPESLLLSQREVEVLSLVAQGLTNAAIAGHLVVSVRTVHAHLRSIYRKLDVHSRTAAAALFQLAMRRGPTDRGHVTANVADVADSQGVRR
jgi:DNA-binding NarL/FixJ family response regulator